MNEVEHKDDAAPAGAPGGSEADFGALIASLRAAGAERFDAVRLHYIQVLAQRALAHQGKARHMLDVKLAQALASFQERFAQARSDANEVLARGVERHPDALDALQKLYADGDFKGLQRLVAALNARQRSSALGALLRQLEQHAPEHNPPRFDASAAPRAELKTIRNFRKTWSKLSVEKQVTQALEQAPANAGPINSHMLVLRSLTLMRDISPDYLNRFMSYADTLLALDQGEKEKAPSPKKPQTARSGRAARAAKK